MSAFAKILVANRGEIACRVMRTARALGYRSVAVHSDADAGAVHVGLADEAVRIGPPPAEQSYLDGAAIIDAARRTGADAVHPGYGFLSESAGFSRACLDAGLVFIGPPPAAIEAMGDKARAKRRMAAAGVPCVPGFLGDDPDDATLAAEAAALGVPLLVKAVAGGGGRGMRLLRDLTELPAALAGARREARAAFGDARLMLERLIEHARHVEVQVFADAHGRCIHLGERDCTAQRRRQKVLEESPSPTVDAALRERLGRDAVAAALAVGYVGAGTVEFVVDRDGAHHFLEMNTRLQVEHPVTECVTGIDMVEWQLRIAAGEALPLAQGEVRFSGHAIEVRLYAEDPYHGFVPQTGRVLHWRPGMARQQGLRIDAGIAEGDSVTPHYDPLLAKFIAHGRDRDDAIRRLRAALEDAPLVGVVNNGHFLRDLLDHPALRAAALTTQTLDGWAAEGAAIVQCAPPGDEAWCLAAAALASRGSDTPGEARPAAVAGYDLPLECEHAGRTLRRTLRVQPAGGALQVSHGDHATRFEALAWHGHRLHHCSAGVQRRTLCVPDGPAACHLVWQGRTVRFAEASPWPQADLAHDPRRAVAPVAGTVSALGVAPGDTVREGQPLVCIEAMKMEMWVAARCAGRVGAVHVGLRDSVAAGALLVEIEPEGEPG